MHFQNAIEGSSDGSSSGSAGQNISSTLHNKANDGPAALPQTPSSPRAGCSVACCCSTSATFKLFSFHFTLGDLNNTAEPNSGCLSRAATIIHLVQPNPPLPAAPGAACCRNALTVSANLEKFRRTQPKGHISSASQPDLLPVQPAIYLEAGQLPLQGSRPCSLL